MKICVLIPAYNEGEYIYDVVCRCRQHIDHILVYDDGSTDNTAAEAERAGIEVIGRQKNKGKGQTLLDGLNLIAERGFDGVITLDADGQHLPEELPLFIQAANNGADIVIGNRMAEQKSMPRVNWYTNVITSLVISMLATRIEQLTGGKLLPAQVSIEAEGNKLLLDKTESKAFTIYIDTRDMGSSVQGEYVLKCHAIAPEGIRVVNIIPGEIRWKIPQNKLETIQEDQIQNSVNQ